MPDRVEKTRQDKRQSLGCDAIRTDQALTVLRSNQTVSHTD